MLKPILTKEQKDLASSLILSGYGNKEIKRRMKVSDAFIYRLKRDLGVYYEKFGRSDEVYNDLGARDNFACQGIGHCADCRHQFQSPCPMAIQDMAFDYRDENPTLFDLSDIG